MDADLTAPEGSSGRNVSVNHRNARVAILQAATEDTGEKDKAEGSELDTALPRAKPVNRPLTSKSAIVYNASQRKNPVLSLVKNVPIEVGDIQADYQVGATTGVLFLSLRYHRLHPEYLHTRIEKLQGIYLLRILLVLCDVTEHHQSLREITKTCLVNNLTVFVAWTNEEAANYLQIFKSSENKSADSLKERVHQSYHAQLENCLTSGKKLQKPDVWTLAGNLGSFASIANASPQQLSVLPGLGPVKVKNLTDAFSQPFKVSSGSITKSHTTVTQAQELHQLAQPDSDQSRAPASSGIAWQDPLDQVEGEDDGRKPPALLSRYLPSPNDSYDTPHVTLTYAQSSDGKIAGTGGARVTISGVETMQMTHWMRTMHDSILIGIGTLLLDDPRLQVTGLPNGCVQPPPPQPLVLDPKLRFPTDCRMLSAWKASQASGDQLAKQPWILCGKDASVSRAEQVESAGARVIRVNVDADGRIPSSDLPSILHQLSLKRVMIEGGAHVISSCLHARKEHGEPMVDLIIVTVAPMVIGEGVAVLPEGEEGGLPKLDALHVEQLGADWVVVCRPTRQIAEESYETQMMGMISSMLGNRAR